MHSKTTEEILEERARQLAKVSSSVGTEIEESFNAVSFRVAGESYAIESKYVSEVYPLVEMTPLPGAPPFVCGLINVRRKIVCVVDLKKIFNISTGDEEDHPVNVIVLEDYGVNIGILVDEVFGVSGFNMGALQDPPPTFSGYRNKFTKGILDESLVLIDAGVFLADEMFTFSIGEKKKL